MNDRRVRVSRGVYGRATPLERPRRRGLGWSGPSLWQRRLLLLVALVAVVGWGIGGMFALRDVRVSAPARAAEIEQATRKVIDGSWRQGNLITMDDRDLVSKLQQADPQLKTVVVRRMWPHGIGLTVTLKQPSLAWSTGNQKYVLDKDGTAIGLLPAGSTLPVVVDGSNLPVQIGGRVASARFVSFASSVVPALAAEGVTVTGLDIKETTLDLTAGTNKGYRIMLDTSRGIEEEMRDYRAVRDLLAAQKRTPAEYIDLRIPNKAYYR